MTTPSNEVKGREFYIQEKGIETNGSIISMAIMLHPGDTATGGKLIHVIEISAYQALQQDAQELVEAASDWVQSTEDECNHQPEWQTLSKALTKFSDKHGSCDGT